MSLYEILIVGLGLIGLVGFILSCIATFTKLMSDRMLYYGIAMWLVGVISFITITGGKLV